MSFHVHFAFSSGISKPIRCPKGTLASIKEHVAHVESTLGLKPERYRDNPAHWSSRNRFEGVSDKVLCEAVEEHNRWVIRLYRQFGEWSKSPVKGGEKITPADAETFWHALEELHVEPGRWTSEYFRERMESLYEVMRGRATNGVSFDAKPLTPEQAGAVITLFGQYLDTGDIRLAVPVGYDCLRASEDGGYSWCEKCGAIAEEDVEGRIRNCRKRGGCPIRNDYGE
jgi:hypothetical protein